MNDQAVEKRIKNHNGSELDIVSIFPTIQGEGPFTGQRAIFVRLAGCNLQCPGCDTDYTTGRQKVPFSKLLIDIQRIARPPYLVVITGGEPFRQNIARLANTLCIIGYEVQIETNGAFPPSESLSDDVTVVCSPKTGSLNPVLARRADCYKYVLHADSVDPEDGLPILALGHSASPRVARPIAGKPIYVQPMDSKDEHQNHLNTQAAVDSCLQYGYHLQLQIHKLIGVE